jgi:hypothetical protein
MATVTTYRVHFIGHGESVVHVVKRSGDEIRNLASIV